MTARRLASRLASRSCSLRAVSSADWRRVAAALSAASLRRARISALVGLSAMVGVLLVVLLAGVQQVGDASGGGHQGRQAGRQGARGQPSEVSLSVAVEEAFGALRESQLAGAAVVLG